MFIDDTGNVHDACSGHPQNRYAGIVGVILDLNYIHSTFDASFEKLKIRHFGVTSEGNSHILHLRRMKKAEGPFSHLKFACCRKRWEDDFFSMYSRASYSVIAACVDKVTFRQRHPNWSSGFYKMLVGNAIERYFYFLMAKDSLGDVVSEATNSKLDGVLKDLYREFYQNGTDDIPGQTLRPKLTSKEIKIEPKSRNVPGVQLADLLAATCFSHCKQIYAEGPAYDSFAMRVADLMEREKFYRDTKGNPHRYGRVWRP
jgi:hypothetical protein